MKKTTCEIGIGRYIYTGVVNVEVNSSCENLTDTCILTFPRKVAWENQKITDLIKKNDGVYVNAGYDDDNDDLFNGYVRDIDASIPVTVHCEDDMFLMKSGPVKMTFQDATLKDILSAIIPSGIEIEAVDIEVGKFRINNATPAKVLEELKRIYGIYSFFQNGKLRSGLRYWGDGTLHELSFQKDILPGHSLTFKSADDTKIKIVATSIMSDNSRIETTAGDEDGEQRTFHYYNVSKAELDRMAAQELEKLKYDGYRGSFTAFGQPYVRHGDTVKLTDRYYPEREGIYVVKSTIKIFGVNGYRQTIELDRLWQN